MPHSLGGWTASASSMPRCYFATPLQAGLDLQVESNWQMRHGMGVVGLQVYTTGTLLELCQRLAATNMSEVLTGVMPVKFVCVGPNKPNVIVTVCLYVCVCWLQAQPAVLHAVWRHYQVGCVIEGACGLYQCV